MDKQIRNLLNVPRIQLGKFSAERRRVSVQEAISWQKGESVNAKKQHVIYSLKDFQIMLAKPGKEAAPDYKSCRYKDGRKGNNPNDMTPTLLKDGRPYGWSTFTFDEIFRLLYELSKKDGTTLELIGCLLYRSAYMLDHEEIAPRKWRLRLPEAIMKEIEDRCPSIDAIPLRVFLYMVEAIALNEDVKYFTLGYNDELKSGTGRRNNLLTYCHLIGVLLERIPFTKFAGSFARPPTGVAPISNASAIDIFRL